MVVARSIWGAKSKLAFGALALGAGAGAATVAKSDDPATALKLCTTVPVRLFRLSATAATIAFDTQIYGGPLEV
ncbi:hypothetical protein HanOQP8_Chr14g0550811 [Helianthus annuus]|nr:hypothetical protein HanOQP8_Chr14g0550811 [Helianthus annuus]